MLFPFPALLFFFRSTSIFSPDMMSLIVARKSNFYFIQRIFFQKLWNYSKCSWVNFIWEILMPQFSINVFSMRYRIFLCSLLLIVLLVTNIPFVGINLDLFSRYMWIFSIFWVACKEFFHGASTKILVSTNFFEPSIVNSIVLTSISNTLAMIIILLTYIILLFGLEFGLLIQVSIQIQKDFEISFHLK